MTIAGREGPRRPQLRVIVVDDERANLHTFRRVFARYFDVGLAFSGNECLAEIERRRCDVVFTDYAMPGINGIDLLQAIRRADPRIARVMITAYSETPELSRALETGTIQILIRKPWSRDGVLRSVEQLAVTPHAGLVDLGKSAMLTM